MSRKATVILIIWAIGTLAMLGFMSWILIEGHLQGLAMMFVIFIYGWVCEQSLEGQ